MCCEPGGNLGARAGRARESGQDAVARLHTCCVATGVTPWADFGSAILCLGASRGGVTRVNGSFGKGNHPRGLPGTGANLRTRMDDI